MAARKLVHLGGVYTEQYCAVASLAALACVNPIISGLWVATAILFKHPGAAVIVPLVILRWHDWGWRHWMRCALATVIPIAAVMAWFAAVGAWADFLYANLWILYWHGRLLPAGAASHVFDLHDRWIKLLLSLWQIVGMTPLIAVCVGLGLASAFRTAAALPVAAACWFVINMAGVLLQANYARHHYTTALPSIIILGATGLAWLIKPRVTDQPIVKAVRICVFVAVAWWAWGQLSVSYAYYRPHLTQQYRRLWLGPAAWQQGPGRLFEERVGTYVREHTSPEDRIHVNGWTPAILSIYWYADRLPAVQLFYDIPFILDRERQLRQLQTARPLYIILRAPAPDRRLREWLESNYTLETTMEADYKVEIFRRQP